MQETRTVHAYAANGNSSGDWQKDRQEVPIPDGYSYVSHSVGVTTAIPNPPEAGYNKYETGVTRGGPGDRIESVWVIAEAGPKDTFGSGISIGVDLHVVISKP